MVQSQGPGSTSSIGQLSYNSDNQSNMYGSVPVDHRPHKRPRKKLSARFREMQPIKIRTKQSIDSESNVSSSHGDEFSLNNGDQAVQISQLHLSKKKLYSDDANRRGGIGAGHRSNDYFITSKKRLS